MKETFRDIISERLQNWLSEKADIHEALVEASDIDSGSFIWMLVEELMDNLGE